MVKKDRVQPAGIPPAWFMLYNTLIAPFAALGFHLSRFSSRKVREGVEGRKGIWRRLEAEKGRLRGCVWFHATSVGEYEQARPVLRALRAEASERGQALPLLTTVFSPSGHQFAHTEITNLKLQTNHNDPNSKSQNLEYRIIGIWNTVLEICKFPSF